MPGGAVALKLVVTLFLTTSATSRPPGDDPASTT
jgi:hypothetical protein